MTRNRAATLAIIIVQAVVIASFAARHEYRRYSWEPIRLRVQPIDPVSLFRGRYVDLSYDWSFTADPGLWKRYDSIYVRLAPGKDGVWQVVDHEKSHLPRPGTVVIRGRIEYIRPEQVRVTTADGWNWEETGKDRVVVEVRPIESYFISERKALLIDDLPNNLPREEREMTVDVVVSPEGHSQLVQLYVGGTTAEEFETTEKSGGS
jgi:uncharacterized membrane-anchored protein